MKQIIAEIGRENMFQAAYRQLLMSIKTGQPEDMRDRFLNSTFAYHMMRDEGRKRCHAGTAAHNRWIENNQDRLNQAHAEFKAWLRLNLGLAGEQQVVDASIAYLDPNHGGN